MSNEPQNSEVIFYVVTLHASKKNSSLLDPTGHLRGDVRRNIDYDIVSSTVWAHKKDEYDIEIPVHDIYNVFISFLCNGYTSKNVNVHGVEKVFDVIQTLFVCKAWSVEQFNRMYHIKWNNKAINPMMSFEYFGDPSKQIILTVERSIVTTDDNAQVMETTMIEEHEVCSVTSQRLHSQILSSQGLLNEAGELLVTSMKFYKEIYTLNEERRDSISYASNTTGRSSLEPSQNLNLLKNIQNLECVGIQNIGNSCYMSASIQCLNSCSLFSNFFYYFNRAFNANDPRSPFRELVGSRNFAKNNRIICSWTNIVTKCRDLKPFAPREFKYEIAQLNQAFNNTKEQDAAEFIEVLLTYLHEGLCYKKEISDQLVDHNNNIIDDSAASETEEASSPILGSYTSKDDLRETAPKQEFSDTPKGIPQDYLRGITAEYEKLISAEKSIVSELFYGMTTTVMECSSCGFKKFKNDLMMFLPLSIPNKVSYHSSSTLMQLGPKAPIKVLVPLNFSIQEAIEYIKVEHDIPSNLIALEYSDGCLVQILNGVININSIKNNIFLYEIKPHRAYLICHLYYRKMYFIKCKIPIDFIIEEENLKQNLYEKLKHYFTKDYSANDFFSKISIKRGQFDRILNLPSIDVVFNDATELFGDKLPKLNVSIHRKDNDVSLRDCLEFCSKNENVCLFCESCEASREFILHSSITKQPKYLIIHLKRFSFEGNGTKINTFIEFPEDNLRIGASKYRLISTANHIEIGLGYGHYVAYLRKSEDWYCCNDSVITKVPGPDKATSYILFYEKISR